MTMTKFQQLILCVSPFVNKRIHIFYINEKEKKHLHFQTIKYISLSTQILKIVLYTGIYIRQY